MQGVAMGVGGNLPSSVETFAPPRLTVDRHGCGIPITSADRNNYPGSINMGFMDGHSEKVKLRRMYEFTWHFGYTPPNAMPIPQ